MHTNSIFHTIRRRRKLLTFVIGVTLSCVLALTPLQPSIAVYVEDVPNPQKIDGSWVSDMADMLSDTSEAELNRMISALEATNGTEIAVVTVPDTQPSSSPKAFATELFNDWGIGKEGADNGVLFLISKGDRRNEIETGYGVEGILTDARIGSILDKEVTPQFKAGNFDAGILAGTKSMIGLLNGGAFIPLVRVQDYAGWIFNKFWVTVAAIAAITTTFIKRFKKAHSGSIAISPIGREPLEMKGVFLGPLLAWVLRGLLGPEASKAKGLSADIPLSKGIIGSLVNWATVGKVETHKDNQLIAHRLSEHIVKTGWKLFGLGFGIAFIAKFIFREQIWVIPFVVSLWLAFELWIDSGETYSDGLRDHVPHNLKASECLAIVHVPTKSVSNRIHQTAMKFASISFDTALMLFGLLILLRLLGFWLWPYVSTAALFTCAGILRLVRSLPDNPKVLCQDCQSDMYPLSKTQLQQHLRKAENAEVLIQTKRYEGWCCPSCSSQVAPESLSIRLFYQDLYQYGYEDCLVCKAKTLKVETKTVTAATTTSTGISRTTRHCYCCKNHSEQELLIPKRKASPARKSSGSHSGDYSASSYGASSYSSGDSYSGGGYSGSSDGGSFGGGDSGGGGAGSDW